MFRFLLGLLRGGSDAWAGFNRTLFLTIPCGGG